MTRHRSLQCKVLLVAVAVLGIRTSALASSNEDVTLQQSSVSQASDRSTAAPQPKAGDSSSPTQAPHAGDVLQQPATPTKSVQSPTPVGTAAAPDTHVDGVAASTPSGVAIAPAKQRRVRKFTIRTALVVGAIVAVGIVSAVSLASPARP